MARIALVAISVLALAWLGVMLRDQKIGEAAQQRLTHRQTPAEVARDIERLNDAELLNPDSTWQLQRATALIRRDEDAAVGEAEALVDREPDNFDAWALLAVATRTDPKRTAEITARVRRIDPLGTR